MAIAVGASVQWGSVNVPSPGLLSEWHRVDLGGAKLSILERHSYGSVLVGGERRGVPFLAYVDARRGRVMHVELEGNSGLTSLATDGLNVGAVAQGRPESGSPPTIWSGWIEAGELLESGVLVDDYWVASDDLPTDGQGRSPDLLWVASADPMDGGMVGALADGRGRYGLHPESAFTRQLIADSTQISIAGASAPGQIRIIATEGSLHVVGPVTDDRDAEEIGIQVWTTPDDEQAWERTRLEPPPDEVSDGNRWALGFWLAGRVGTRPVFYDDGGRSLDVPDVALDPHHPAVFIAEVPVGNRAILALQTTDGPALFWETADGWRRKPVPSGRLTGARYTLDHRTDDSQVFVLIDDELWWRTVDPPRP